MEELLQLLPALNDVIHCAGLSQELGWPSINIHYKNWKINEQS